MAGTAARSKRTYCLQPETIHRVRELAARGYSSSQDSIIDQAVDRLYRETLLEEEAHAWEEARKDPQFEAEVREIAAGFDTDRWPQ